MECEVCGSRNVTRREVEGFLLEECGLCGNLQGDDDAVARIEELRTGRARGFDDAVIPLVIALEETGAFEIVRASGGDGQGGESPSIFFRANGSDTRYVERLLRSLELANRATKLVWLLELSLQRGIVYILRPRFWKEPGQVTAPEIRLARSDIAEIAKRLRRDANLSWWRAT